MNTNMTKVSKVFKNLCILMHRMTVALAEEGLTIYPLKYLPKNGILGEIRRVPSFFG